MGGKSSKTTTGYKYYAGFQMVLARYIHKVLRIRVDEKEAWNGVQIGEGLINVNSPNLFGAPGSSDPEGGVVATINFQPGLSTQQPDSYLVSKLGAKIPAFRGVSAFVCHQGYLGNNPYMKQWDVRAERVHALDDGSVQWYDSKAAINNIPAPVPYAVPFPNRNASYFVVGACEEVVPGPYTGNQGWWNGYIDSYRVTKGVARYAAPLYDVSHAPFGNAVTDPHYDKVILLLRMQGVDGGVVFVDDKGHAVTAHNVTTTTSKLLNGSSVAVFDGASSWLECEMGADKNFGNSPWTMDAWVWMSATTGPNELGCGLFGFGDLNVGGYDTAWYVKDDAWSYRQSFTPQDPTQLNAVIQDTSPRPVAGRWSFVSVCWDGSKFWMHQDGQLLTASGGSSDINPAHMLRECLLNSEWGYGYSVDDIDDAVFRSAADTLASESFGISYLWEDESTSIGDVIEKVLAHIDGVLYVDRRTQLWTLKLLRADYDQTTLHEFKTGVDIIAMDEFNRPGFMDLINEITVNYYNIENSSTGTITLPNAALRLQQGVKINKTVNYEMVCSPALASQLCQRDLAVESSPLATGTIYLIPNQYSRELHRGSVCKLTFPEYGLEQAVVRVNAVSFGDGKTKRVKVSFVEDIFAMPSSALSPPKSGGWVDVNSDPKPLTYRKVIEVPYFYLIRGVGQTQLDANLAASPGIGYIGVMAARVPGALNASLYVDSGAGYVKEGTLDFCPFGTLSADVGYLDNSLTLTDYEDLEELDGTFFIIDDEIMSYDTQTNGVLSGVLRGLFDTVPGKHVVGSPVFFIDNYLDSDNKDYELGESVNVRLTTVSVTGELGLVDAPTDSLSLVGRATLPYPPGNVKFNGVAYPVNVSGSFTITWSARNRVSQADIAVDTTAGDVAAAPNTRYTLRLLDSSSSLIIERSNIGPTTATVVLNYTGAVTAQLFSVDNDGRSLQQHEITFQYSPPGGTVVSAITTNDYTPVDNSTIIDGGGDS